MAALQAHALPLSDIRGQGYDGTTAAMSSNTVGDRTRLRQESPLAVYTHCSGHCLNPVIAGSSAIVSIRNMLDKLKETCLFFSNSPKREIILISVMSTDEPHAHRKKPLLNQSRTRWGERQDAYLHFHQPYPTLCTRWR